MFITKKKHEEAIAALEARLTQAIEFHDEWQSARIAELVATAETKLRADAQELFAAALVEDRKKRYDSDEPYVEILSEKFSEEGGVGLRLDWNQPFINYLKKNGFTGPSDEAIVDSWLVSLSRERMEAGSEFK